MNDWPFAFFPEDLSTWNACVSEYSDIKAERDRLKAAFDDRVRVIELQLEDKRQMQELIDRYRKALEEVYRVGLSVPGGSMNRTLNTINDIAKQALGVSDE